MSTKINDTARVMRVETGQNKNNKSKWKTRNTNKLKK